MGRTGQKVHKGSLGAALVRTQKRSSATNTSDIQSSAGKHVSARDGGDATVALASYLEGSSLDDFLASAVLANREFTAVKERVLLLEEPDAGAALVPRTARPVPKMSFRELRVPRRPAWDASTTAAELNRLEKESFLAWRRELAAMEEAHEELEVTPFEKNLEVWRQLWHVLERSDVVVQIVDARNPLFYRSADLEAYAAPRRTLLVVNKADFLSARQRRSWGDYLAGQGLQFVFFSARDAQAAVDEEAKQRKLGLRTDVTESEAETKTETKTETETESSKREDDGPYPVLTRLELLAHLTGLARAVLAEVGVRAKDKGLAKLGMVGFPNVGKSSVINALLGASTYSHKTQRVAVGATPGKTKHFQTLVLSDAIMLCDCPGLVFPSFVNSKAEMYCCGVLPISQLRDHVGPCQLMCRRIPRRALEATYGIRIAAPATARDEDPADVYALLEAFARARGYATTGKGGPDTSRAARDLLRDYAGGKLLYCHPPPGAAGADADAFDIHMLARERFPDAAAPPTDSTANATTDADAEPGEDEDEDEIADFDRAVEDKRVVSKRLQKHGRKGRKGRDKNPYEGSDLPADAFAPRELRGGSRKRPDKRRGPQSLG